MSFDWKNPWVLGGAALVLILLVMFRGGSSSDSNSSATTGVASQSVATTANVQLAQLQDQLTGVLDTNASQVNISDTSEQTSQLGLALGFLSNMGSNTAAIAQTEAAVNINDNNNSTAFAINADNQATYAKLAPQLAQIQSQTAIAQAQISASTQIGLGQISQGTTLAQSNNGVTSGALNNLFGLIGGSKNSAGATGIPAIASIFS